MSFKVNKDNCHLVYDYYINQGFNCILLSNIFHQLLYIFVVSFSFFLFTCIDYRILFKTHDIHASLIQGFIHIHPFITICMILLCIIWVWYIISFVYKIPELRKIQEFYNISLGISDSQLSCMKWEEVLKKNLEFTSINKQLLQKDNFMIELYKKDNWEELGIYSRFVSKLLNWILYNSFDVVLFYNPKKFETINKKTSKLKKYYKYTGIIITLLSPFILIFLIMYYFFKYTEEFKKSPASAGNRDWNLYARWKLRKNNELPHLFERRLLKSNIPTNEFLDTSHNSITTIVAKFITFVTGSFLAVLWILTLYDDHILVMMVDQEGRSVLWYIGFFGIIFSFSSSFIPNTNKYYDPNKSFDKVVEHTEYFPEAEMSEIIEEYDYLYSHKLTQLLEEIISVLVTPYLLFKVLPDKSQYITELFFEKMEYNESLNGYYYIEDIEMNTSINSIVSNSSHGSNNSNVSLGLNTILNPNLIPSKHQDEQGHLLKGYNLDLNNVFNSLMESDYQDNENMNNEMDSLF